jgi:hypothetical protein
MRGQQALAVGRAIGGASATDDLRELEHRRSGRRSVVVHQALDRIARRVTDLAGQMGVDGGGARAAVAEVVLNDPQIDPVLEQVGGVGVPIMPGPALPA